MGDTPRSHMEAAEAEAAVRRDHERRRLLSAWDPEEVKRNNPDVEDRFIESLTLYVHARIRPGGFLQHALQNNLTAAVLRADPRTLAGLRGIVILIHNEVPAVAWGSKEAVEDWLSKKTELL